MKRLTSGTTINGTIMAIVEAIGEFCGPNLKNKTIASVSPVAIPALAPQSVVLFQYNPYRYGAMNDPATAPQESDIRVMIKLNSFFAIKYESATKTPLKKRIIKSEFSLDMRGFTWPLYMSIAIAEAETKISEDKVDIDAESTKRTIKTMSPGGI